MRGRVAWVKPLFPHLPFNVYELGKHQRAVEGQFGDVVVELSAAHVL